MKDQEQIDKYQKKKGKKTRKLKSKKWLKRKITKRC